MKPNVVVFICDDLGWGDLAVHGNPVVATPNLDALHGESARLTRYCSGPLCTPARASLMTGRYHHRTRAIDTYAGCDMLDPSERTLGHAFAAAGYRTGAFGKWHLGDTYPVRAKDMGFEETLVHGGGGMGQPGDHRDNYARRGEAYFDPVLIRNGHPEQQRGYCTDVIADAAIEFIRSSRDGPFFAYVATNAPHTPLIVGDEWCGKYREAVGEVFARIYGMVENIDHNVGRILRTLTELGLEDDTIFVFTSDHGPCPSALDFTGPHRERFNAGLRGLKGSLYEGGVRVPCFWRRPGRYAPADIGAVSSPIDVLPTLCEAAGVAMPDRPIDGVSFDKALQGGDAPVDRTIFMQFHRGDAAVRYKNYAVITDRYKLYRRAVDAGDELYDVAADPFEESDVAGEHPEVVLEMRASYEAWFEDVNATMHADPRPVAIRLDGRDQPTVLSRNNWRIDSDQATLTELEAITGRVEAHWEVEIGSDALLDAEVRLEPDSMGDTQWFDTVNLEIDGVRHSMSCTLWVSLYEFRGVPIKAGRSAVRAWAERKDRTNRALYVDVFVRKPTVGAAT